MHHDIIARCRVKAVQHRQSTLASPVHDTKRDIVRPFGSESLALRDYEYDFPDSFRHSSIVRAPTPQLPACEGHELLPAAETSPLTASRYDE